MTTLEDICTCEFGPLLGDGRTDSNRCPVHDMTREELVEYAANGWREVAALEARIEALEKAQSAGEALWPYVFRVMPAKGRFRQAAEMFYDALTALA